MKNAFTAAMLLCAAFFVLTVVAMLAYPGGKVGDPDSSGYSFFENFFSDLGQTHTHSGAPNTPSLVLFCLGLAAMACGTVVFFAAFARMLRGTRAGAALGVVSAVCATIAGAAFVGVALTPWNLYLSAHNVFVQWAFRALLAAVAACTAGILAAPDVPRRFAWVFGAFGVVLAAYVVLLAIGPRPATAEGARVQATGQKAIVYVAVATILIQAAGARAQVAKR